MSSLLANPADPAAPDVSHVRPVAAANERPEPSEELLYPSSSDMSGAAERVAAENFNPNHDDRGKFTFDGGTGGGRIQKPKFGTPQAGHVGSAAPGDSPRDKGPKDPPDYSPYWGSYGGASSGSKRGGKTQNPAPSTSQTGQAAGIAFGGAVGAAGAQAPAGRVQIPTGLLPQRGGSQSPTYTGNLSSAPYKADQWSGQSWAAAGREAIAQVSKMTGREVLPPVPDIEKDVRQAHPESTAGFSAGSPHGTATVHDLIPVLRKHQIACEDLSSKAKDDRSGIARIGDHLRNGPVLVTVSSGANAHAELVMRQHKNGLYAVYNPLKGVAEDVLHAAQIDPRGVSALSPLPPGDREVGIRRVKL